MYFNNNIEGHVLYQCILIYRIKWKWYVTVEGREVWVSMLAVGGCLEGCGVETNHLFCFSGIIVIRLVVRIKVWDLMPYTCSLVDREHCFVGTCYLICSGILFSTVKRFYSLVCVSTRLKGMSLQKTVLLSFTAVRLSESCASVTFIQLLVFYRFISGLREYS
jgi:hypothetical protein